MLFDEEQLDAGGAGCYACRLHKKAKHKQLKAIGTGTVPILIIGDAPTKQGEFFEEEHYEILDGALSDLCINIEHCRYMTSVACPTPGDRIPLPREVEFCRSNIWQELREHPASVILLLGDSALLSIVGQLWKRDLGNSQRWEGFAFPYSKAGAWVIVNKHPRSLFKKDRDGKIYQDKALSGAWLRYIEKAVDLLDKPFDRKTTLLPNTEHLHGDDRIRYLKQLIEKHPRFLAFDYETNCIRPQLSESKIFAVGFACDEEIGRAMLFDSSLIPYLRKIFKDRRIGKIASNMKFEDVWTRLKIECPVVNWVHDTMLCAHVENNRERYSGLKTQVFLQYGIPDYAEEADRYLKSQGPNAYNKIHEMKPSALLEYNALDAVFEYRIAMRQMEMIS